MSLFSYDTWFPFFDGMVTNIHGISATVAFVILSGTLIGEFAASGDDHMGRARAMIKAAILVGLIASDKYFLNMIRSDAYDIANTALKNPFLNAFNAFVSQMNGSHLTGSGSGPLSWIFLASNSITMAIVGAICFLVGLIVLPILWIEYLFATGLCGMSLAFLPIFIALLGTQRWSGMGTS